MPWTIPQAAWSLVKGILKAVPWWVWIAILVALAFFVYGERRYAAGQAERQALWDAATAEQEGRIRELQAEIDATTAKIEVRTVERVKTIHEKGDTIIRRIPQLVPVGSCDLPVGWRVLHDEASGHEVPDSTASAD